MTENMAPHIKGPLYVPCLCAFHEHCHVMTFPINTA